MRFLRALLCIWFTTALSFAESPPKKHIAPDIFLITIDTLRADHVHCYGYERIQTPALDALSHDGIRFSQAFTPSPITNSSHTSILTGLLPSSHGVTDFGAPLSKAHPTGAELLHAHGYRTAAFIGAVILDSTALAPGLDRGFDFYDNFPKHAPGKSRWGRLERRGMDVVHRAESWLSAHPDGPRFVWVHLYDPHDPYEPPQPFSRIYKDRLYDGEIAYADSALANFIAYLKNNHWYASSLIVVVGDHGEGLGEHHEDTHGIFLYDSTTHVPLILKMPAETIGPVRNRTVEDQVRTTDIAPTLLDVVKVPAPVMFDGASLSTYFSGTGADPAVRVIFGETDYPLRFGWAPLRSLRTREQKFIEAPRPELYRLDDDPGELSNRYEPWNEQVKSMRELLAAVRAKAPPQSSVTTGGKAASQETVDELKALGYLGRADAGSSTNVPEPSMLADPKDKIEEQNLLHHAMMEQEDGRIPAARQLLDKVLQLDPKSYPALRQLGEIELGAEDYSNSSQHLKAALEARPGDAKTGFYAAQALEKMHDLQGAREALEASLKQMPGQLEARLLLGQVYLESKSPQSAEDQYSAALLLQPGNLAAEIGLAQAQIAENHLTDATSTLESISKSHANAEVFELLSQAYSGLGKKLEAQKAAAHARQLRSLFGRTKN